jgi:hypothetical protein
MGFLLWSGGCKRKGGNIAKRQSDPVQVANYRKGAERGMKPVTFEDLTQQHVGKRCVVTADTLAEPLPTPPPRGMVMVFGDVSVYTAELDRVSPETLALRAKYPSGSLKRIDIAADSIHAIAVAP